MRHGIPFKGGSTRHIQPDRCYDLSVELPS
jgi:hypothetical protein